MANNGFDIAIDELTLARARRGDRSALERIYRSFQAPAFTVAMRVCNCRELAQEVTQEAFITAFRRIRQFRGEAPFWGWLRRVVINHAISALRKLPSAELIEFQDYQAPRAGDEDSISRAMDLEQALQRLNHQDRAVIWLHDVEGYRHEEIAAMFGKTESFSKTRLSRARRRVRELIQTRDEASRTGVMG